MGKSNAQKILDLMYDNLFHDEGERMIFFNISKTSEGNKDKECVFMDVWPDWIIDIDKIQKLDGKLEKCLLDKKSFDIPYKEPVQYSSTDKWIDKRSFNVKLLDVLTKAFGDKNVKET